MLFFCNLANADFIEYYSRFGNDNGCKQEGMYRYSTNPGTSEFSVFNCGSWQGYLKESFYRKNVSGDAKYMVYYSRCVCDKNCIEYPKNPRYYDNNASYNDGTIQNGKLYQDADTSDNVNVKNISLPIILSWDHVDGWQDKKIRLDVVTIRNGDGEHRWPKGVSKINALSSQGKGTSPSQNPAESYGVESYRIQIQSLDNIKTNIYGIENINLSEAQNYQIDNINGNSAYSKLLAQNAFNSRNEGGACFFQTNSAYRWRVLPCCDEAGTQCKAYADDEGWWIFSTSPAPELLGIEDKDHAGIISQDPDWNGTQALTGVDFCSAKLYWCKVKLVEPEPANYNRFDKTYNNGQIIYAANYQMRVKFSENWSLGLISAASSAVSSWSDFVQSKINSLKTNALFQSLTTAVQKALTDVDFANKESCHYLQKQDGGGCKPEHLAFTSSYYMNELVNNVSFKPFFSAKENTSQNRNLFTGDYTGALKYSWQIKTCFDTSSGVDDDNFPYCGGYNGEDYGQKWQFVGKQNNPSTFEPPKLLSPENNANCQDQNKLVGLDDTLNWSAPCGANSFIYDVLEKNGESIFEDDDTYDADLGRRITTSQALIDIADEDEPSQENDPGKIRLKINTCYQWKVRSCWPSIPIPEMSADKICGKLWNSAYFYTTGRAPNSLWTSNDTAPSVTFNWENVDSAGSFNIGIYKKQANGKFDFENPTIFKTQTASSYIFEYAAAKENYQWRVQTCANANGEICGDWSVPQSYTANDFTAPTSLSPSGKIKQLPQLTWTSNARYFLVTVKVANAEKSTTCDPDWFNREYDQKIVSETSLTVKTAEKNSSPYCAGNYEFTVQPCFDGNCDSRSSNKATASFSIADEGKKSGLMVCGQSTDDPNTEYNEKEACQPKHLVLLLKVLVDFVMFKLAFMLLPVMTLITGGLFYLSQDKDNLIPHIKDIWKKIGIGYGILFFSWAIVSILTGIVGYSDWWKIL